MIKVDLNHNDEWRFCGGVYGILCTISHKWYIGSAIYQISGKRKRNLSSRLMNHRSSARIGKHHNCHFQRAWDKYGENAFEFYIIEIVDNQQARNTENKSQSDKLLQREQYYLDAFKAADPVYGYNQQPKAGNSLGWKHSEESLIKIRKQAAVRTPARNRAAKNLGKIGKSWLGKKRRPESIKKTADAQRFQLNEVKQIFANNGCELLATEYIDAHTLMSYKCSCGRIAKITYGNFHSGSRCWQCRNKKISTKKTHIYVTLNGVTKNLNDWSKETGIKQDTLQWRFNHGRTPEEILNVKPWQKIPTPENIAEIVKQDNT